MVSFDPRIHGHLLLRDTAMQIPRSMSAGYAFCVHQLSSHLSQFDFESLIRAVVSEEPRWVEFAQQPPEEGGTSARFIVRTSEDGNRAFEYLTFAPHHGCRPPIVHCFELHYYAVPSIAQCNCGITSPSISDHFLPRSILDYPSIRDWLTSSNDTSQLTYNPQFFYQQPPAAPSPPTMSPNSYFDHSPQFVPSPWNCPSQALSMPYCPVSSPWYRPPTAVPTTPVSTPMTSAISPFQAPHPFYHGMPFDRAPESQPNAIVRTESRGVYIRNINYATTMNDLGQHLATVAQPIAISFKLEDKTPPKKANKGIAIAKFETACAAEKVIQTLNGKVFQDRSLEMRFDKDADALEPLVVGSHKDV